MGLNADMLLTHIIYIYIYITHVNFPIYSSIHCSSPAMETA